MSLLKIWQRSEIPIHRFVDRECRVYSVRYFGVVTTKNQKNSIRIFLNNEPLSELMTEFWHWIKRRFLLKIMNRLVKCLKLRLSEKANRL